MRFTPVQIRKIENKRRGKERKTLAILSIIFGACFFITIPEDTGSDIIIDIVFGILFVFIGARRIIHNKSKARKWDRYEACIDNNGNTSINNISRKTGFPTDRIRIDLQEMIRNHFFIGPYQDRDAYIDGERDLLVMTKWPEGIPLVNPETTVIMEKDYSKGPFKITAKDIIRSAAEKEEDGRLKDALKRIYDSVERIEKKTEENPELEKKQSVEKLHTYYLPQIADLVGKVEKGGLSEGTFSEIINIMETCAEAFINIERELSEKEDIETMIDIDVLRQTLTREGVLGSDFEMKEM